MGLVRMHGHIEAPVEAVFDYAVDFNRSAEWNVNIIEMAPGPPLAKVGDTFSGKMKFLGRIYTGSGVVTQFERPERSPSRRHHPTADIRTGPPSSHPSGRAPTSTRSSTTRSR